MRLGTLVIAGMLTVGSPVFADGEQPLANGPSPPYWSSLASADQADRHGDHPAHGRTAEGRQALVTGATALPFISLFPCRLVDTRGNAPLTGGFLPSATVRNYTLTGVCGV